MANHKSISIAGRRFGRLVAIEPTGERRGRALVWRCVCDCGDTKEIVGTQLRRKQNGSQSCGCLTAELAASRVTTHGLSRTHQYRAWQQMIERCTNPRSDAWANYGGRGISVHPAWRKSYEAFYAYVGPRPSRAHTLDRIDNNGNYEPGNVRWATRAEQNQNTRRAKRWTVNGTTFESAREAARETGLSQKAVYRTGTGTPKYEDKQCTP